MKFTNYNELTNPADYIFAPDVTHVTISPKMNGVACRISVDPVTNRLTFTTRKGKRWRDGFFDAIIDTAAFERFMKVTRVMMINAELYPLGTDIPLATLAGWVNVSSDRISADAVGKLSFYMYDCQFPERRTYYSRMTQLADELYNTTFRIPAACLQYITADTMAQVAEAHAYNLATYGEGSVIRLDPQYYMSDDNPSVDPRTIKWKRYHEEEGEILVAYEGLGKRTGMLGSFLVRTPTGKQIHVGGGAGVDDATLTKWWNNPPLGKQLTYRYDELSVNGKPLRAQIVAIRDYE